MINLISNNIQNGTLYSENKELYSLIILRPGGKNTVRIIDEILVKPRNANQLARILNLDYKTVKYHLNIICSHRYIIKEKFGCNYSYIPSEKLYKNLEKYMIIKEHLE